MQISPIESHVLHLSLDMGEQASLHEAVPWAVAFFQPQKLLAQGAASRCGRALQ